MMTKKLRRVVDNSIMANLPIYSKEELLSLFEKARGTMSKREFASKIGIKYQHVQDWFRPDRKNNRINYEDSIRIINAALNIQEKDMDPIVIANIVNEMQELKNYIKKLAIEIALTRNLPSRSNKSNPDA